MRRLAQALDREAMTLYRYARNKAELLDGVVELVLGDLSLDSAAADWSQELRDLAAKFQDLALAHPNVLPLLVILPRATPLGLRPLGTVQLLEDFLELLTRAGFAHGDALHAYRLFFAFLHGHALGQLQEAVENQERAADELRLALHRLPRELFPHLHAAAAELSGYDGLAEFQQGLEMVITGLQTLQQTGQRPGAA